MTFPGEPNRMIIIHMLSCNVIISMNTAQQEGHQRRGRVAKIAALTRCSVWGVQKVPTTTSTPETKRDDWIQQSVWQTRKPQNWDWGGFYCAFINFITIIININTSGNTPSTPELQWYLGERVPLLSPCRVSGGQRLITEQETNIWANYFSMLKTLIEWW